MHPDLPLAPHSAIHDAPHSPIRGMQDLDHPIVSLSENRERTYTCHDKIYPKNCNLCKPNISQPCYKHILINCSGQNCQKHFHKKCICHLLCISLSQEQEINSYLCMECTSTQQASNQDVTSCFDTLDLWSNWKSTYGT